MTPPTLLATLENDGLTGIKKHTWNCLIKVYTLCEYISNTVREKVSSSKLAKEETDFFSAQSVLLGPSFPAKPRESCTRNQRRNVSESKATDFSVILLCDLAPFCSRSAFRMCCTRWTFQQQASICPASRSSSSCWMCDRPSSRQSRNIC